MTYKGSLGSVSGSASWGGITGTLASQTDLNSVLNGKAATSHNHDGTYVPLSGLSELIDDRVAALITAGANVTVTYDDGSGTLTIAASGGGSSNSYIPAGW